MEKKNATTRSEDKRLRKPAYIAPRDSGEQAARAPHMPISSPAGPRSVIVLLIAALIVLDVSLFTNRMAPRWDMVCYIDMAVHGVVGNSRLIAPFAYRPAAPLLIGMVARLFHIGPETTFRIAAHLMCVAFIMSCFYFGRSLGGTGRSALIAAVMLALYFYIIKWNVFACGMVDIYAYPLVLLAFWALLEDRVYLCLVVCAVGLFFKEFLILPLSTQAVVLVVKNSRHWRKVLLPVGLTTLVLFLCFVAPRLLIPVIDSFQDIDPLSRPSSLSRLYSYPLSWKRDLNIIFSYAASWLPIYMILTPSRLRLLYNRLRPYRLPVLSYLVFHFFLVMYGGANLAIFVTYSLPVQILIFVILLDEGRVRPWELVLALVAVLLFNRFWMPVPSPETSFQDYSEFYGGYHMLLTARSITRMAELLFWALAAWLIRATIIGARRQPEQGEFQP